MSVYKDETFIPVLGPEHFELLVKQPLRFAVKHYEVTGLRAEVFRELEGVLTNGVKMSPTVRNRTLLFEMLPVACGLEPVSDSGVQDQRLPRELRARLQTALKELRDAHEQLLGQCRAYIHEAFGVRQDAHRLREDLRSRASYLQGRSIEPILSRFIFAATDDSAEEQQWLQSLVMVIAEHERLMKQQRGEASRRALVDALAEVLDSEDDTAPCVACHY